VATNDTKVHTRDAQLPPFSEVIENGKIMRILSLALVRVDEENPPKIAEALKETARCISRQLMRSGAAGAA
jgi:hypothetical protein